MERKSFTRNRWVCVGLLVGLWTVLALSSGVSTYVSQLLYDKPVGWDLAMRRSFKEWYSIGFLAFGILWLCNRVRLQAVGFRRWLVIHLGAAVVFSALCVALVSWLTAGERSVQDGSILTFSFLFKKLGVHYFVWDVMLYWTIVVGHLGWTSFQGYREREVQAAQLQQQLVEARLQALRMQINPHFLFNTLNTVSALIHDNPHAADRMVVRLSELLRRTLDHGETQEIALREEIEFLKGYLEIEEARFGDRLAVELRVEPGTEDLLVPYLLLQPLVENAIRHGIEPREEPGRIEISVRRDGDRLELRVKDNGDGIAHKREGIGLSNTRWRLAHLYPDNFSFDLINGTSGGLEARIRIPCRATPAPAA
jgi:two-component sensor histidine kinase